MRHILMDEKAIVVKNGVGGWIEIWLRGVLYAHTMDMEWATKVIRNLRYKNRKIAC